MREQYCIHAVEQIRSDLIIRKTKQQKMFRVLYPIVCRTHWVDCISKVMPKFMKIEFAQSFSILIHGCNNCHFKKFNIIFDGKVIIDQNVT